MLVFPVDETRALSRSRVGQVSTILELKKVARRGYIRRGERTGMMPLILYDFRSSGRSVKAAARMMPAKGSGVVLRSGATMSCGRKGEAGSAKKRAVADVTAVPRDWPRSTVREAGWARVSRA